MTETTEQTIDVAMKNLEEGKAGEPVNLPPTETVEHKAARSLTMAIPVFRTKLRALMDRNRTEVSRVLEALIEHPLETETHKFTTKQAAELYELGNTITAYKFVLFNEALKVQELVAESDEKMKEQAKEQGE